MNRLLVGYTLAAGLPAGSIGFVLLALTAADTLPESQLPITIALFVLAAVLIILPFGLIVWSLHGIRNGTISKAGFGIPLIALLYIVFLGFFLGERFLAMRIKQQNNALEQQQQIQDRIEKTSRGL